MGDLRLAVNGYHASGAFANAEIPAGTQVGDLLVLILADRYLPSLPAGWVTEDVISGTSQSGRLAWKIAEDGDISSGVATYILAGASTGSWTVLVYERGTFNEDSPIGTLASSIEPEIHSAMPYQAVGAGQFMYHFVSAKVPSPAPIFATAGVPVLTQLSETDVISTVFADHASSDTTLSQTWSSAATVEGAYRVSFTVSRPAGLVSFPPISSTAIAVVATYDVVLVSPGPDEFLLTSSPWLTVFATGSPEPFQVEFQVSTESSFSTLHWSQVITGATTGHVSAQVGVGLVDGVQYYWRARSGDGTTWGAWVVVAGRPIRITLNRSQAHEYIHFNIGQGDVTDGSITEYLHKNVGTIPAMEDVGVEYLHENVGFLRTIDRKGSEYLYYSPVTDGIPNPHLWFLWKPAGFVGDRVLIYGQGLGSLASEYNGKLYIATAIDPPQGTSYISGTLMGIFDWSVLPASGDAYGPDRRISTDTGSPFTNVETQIVEVTIPIAVAPSIEEGAVYRLVQALTDGGASNELPWLAYPTIPTPASASGGVNRTGAVVRVGAELTTFEQIPQNWSVFDPEPYIIAGSRAIQVPAAGIGSVSLVRADEYSTRESLDAALSVELGAEHRWVPDASFLVPRADLGTGVTAWVPAQGPDTMFWKMQLPNAPYINPAYAHASRLGRLERQAMVLEGQMWLGSDQAVDEGPVFTLAMVFVPHPNPEHRDTFYYEMWTDDTLGAGAAATVRMRDMMLWHFAGDTDHKMPMPPLSGRPIIVVVSSTPSRSNIMLVSERGVLTRTVSHSSYVTTNIRHWIGRPENNALLSDRTARIDLLDVSWWGSALSTSQMWQAANTLDGVYGVTGSRLRNRVI